MKTEISRLKKELAKDSGKPLSKIMRKRWTKEEDDVILDHQNLGAGEIRRKFLPDRKSSSIHTRRWVLMKTRKVNRETLAKVWHEEGENPEIKLK